tara:strand:- start:1291 stop:1503 length:213 start_codon:yes stop_codon:yes gene_type:complete
MKEIIAVLLIFGIVLVGGCVEQPVQEEEQPVCGNEIIETGEECDNTGCEAGQICTESCVCESLTPPQLPP